jgi:hypothetical protein
MLRAFETVRGPFILLSILALPAGARAAAAAPAPAETPPPATPQEFYNAGAQKLREGKLREAEAFLESTLASQMESLQPPALYNLGHVRFRQGIEELKKGPSAKPTLASARQVEQEADAAIQSANAALADNDLERLVSAYLRGRGARKELKAAIRVVQRALDSYRTTLTKWERSSDDFKSTVELKRASTDAQFNADVVDRCIAKLVDSLHELQQCANGLGDKKTQLGEKMKQLRGRIPAPNMPPGAAGDDDEDDDDQPHGPQLGQEEGPTRDGQEMTLTPEQASWLLDGFKLDSERRLPMGGDQQAEPRNRTRPTW